jgi:hypothetical protein
MSDPEDAPASRMSGPGDDPAIQLDVYLDHLLARHGRPIAPVEPPLSVEPELAAAAAAVSDALPRFHPSFRFEERLAARLREVAVGRGGDPAGVPVALHGPSGDPEALALRWWIRRPAWTSERGLMLVGGAIASGVSIAGAALLAWRRAKGDDRWQGMA